MKGKRTRGRRLEKEGACGKHAPKTARIAKLN